MPSAVDNDYPSLDSLVDLRGEYGDERWRVVSDIAQVVANFLRCHPRVENVRYPGLKSDQLFTEASHKLVGGFGPVVRYRVAGEWHELLCESCDPKVAVLELERNLRVV